MQKQKSCKLVYTGNLWECLEKPIPIEIGSSEDSDDSTISSDSTGSPPAKRRRPLRLIDFKTPEDIEYLKSVATEVVELKDYAEWFLSRSETNVHILDPLNYGKWVSTLGTEARAKVIIHPFNYCTWYYYLVEQGIQPPREIEERESTEQRDKRYGELALEHFKKTRNCIEDYEYTKGCEILHLDDFFHFNFYARLKVSESRHEPGPEELFFAELAMDNEVVSRSCILDSKEFDNPVERHNSVVRHPKGFECWDCVYCDFAIGCCACDL